MEIIEKKFHIKSINTKRMVTDQEINIELNGKNLIITGDNGSGKTKLVEGIYNVLQTFIIDTGVSTLSDLELQANQHEREANSVRPGEAVYNFYNERYKKTSEKLNSAKSIRIEINDAKGFKESFHIRNAFIKYFSARRAYEASEGNRIDSVNSFIKSYAAYPPAKDKDMAQLYFENYISSLVTYGMLNDSTGNKSESNRISDWFNKVNDDLRTLFEDPSLELVFDIENLKLKIEQKNKAPYFLSQLSSGYSSILAIYAELLMCVELNRLPRHNLQGIVIIDEIDAHLHVSLQKVIFQFFKNAFPGIQFILTTHSPFVVQSVNDAIIYDLSKLEQLDDLSMYSYEAITKGLLGEKTESEIMTDVLTDLENALTGEPVDLDVLRSILAKMEPYTEKMNPRARSFYIIGLNKVLEKEQGGE